MVPVGPHASLPAERPVHSFRDADGQRLKPTGERLSTVGLDDHVKMVGLYGKLQDAQSAS